MSIGWVGSDEVYINNETDPVDCLPHVLSDCSYRMRAGEVECERLASGKAEDEADGYFDAESNQSGS